MKKYIYCLLIASTHSALAADLAGTYRGGGHFGTVQITSRGPNFLLTTCGAYSNYCLSIAAEIRETAPNQFTSTTASITAYYGNYRCEYPIRLQLTQDGTRVYLSEFGPSYFPLSSTGCPERSQLLYSSYVEPKAYSRE
jgi:hypothetical protein